MYTEYKTYAKTIPCYKERIALLRKLALEAAQKSQQNLKVA